MNSIKSQKSIEEYTDVAKSI